MEPADFLRGRESTTETRNELPREASKRRKRTNRRVHSVTPISTPHSKIDLDAATFRSPGVKAMGMVTEVTEAHLRLSLPHGGEVSVVATEASDVLSALLEASEGSHLKQLYGTPRPLTDLFAPGQFVYGTYYLDSWGDLQFSLKLSRLYDTVSLSKLPEGTRLAACVRTKEDHGYTLSFGTKGVSGFLKDSDLEPYYGTGAVMLPGQLIDGVIKSISANGVLQLSVDPVAVKTSMMVEGASADPLPVLPGTLIHAEITHVLDNGLVTRAMTRHSGIVSLFHLPEEEVVQGWQLNYTVGQMMKARVLAFNPHRAESLLSLKPFLVHLELPKMPAVIGQVFSDAVIQRADPGGLSLKLPTEPVATLSYVFRHNLGDLPLQSSDFKLKQTVKLRVTGFHAMEGLIVGSLKESVIRSGIVCFDDLYPGRVAEGSIVRIFDDHVYVSVGEGIEGCARQCGFSSNVSLRQIFNPGQLVTYRVLKLRPEIRQVMISLDAQLVHASLPFLTSWDDADVGMRVIGYVLTVKERVVIVAFAGEIYGVLPKENIHLSDQQTLSECFYRNQVIKTWIKSVQPHKRQIILTTLKAQLEKAAPVKQSKQNPYEGVCSAPEGLSIGDIADATVVKVSIFQHSISKTCLPEQELKHRKGFLVDYHVHESDVKGKAILPVYHLSDHPFAEASIWKLLKEGSPLGEVVILKTESYVQVSRKASLVKNASLLPHQPEDVKENMLLHGYISFVGEDFVNVSFLGDLTGRVFSNQLLISGISPRKQCCVGQSVVTRVIKVDSERGHVHLTLNPSRTTPSDAEFLENAFSEMAQIQSLSAGLTRIGRDQIGSLMEIMIQSVDKHEARCALTVADGVHGVIPVQHFEDGPPDVTSKKRMACLLDLTPEGIPVLSLKPSLVQRGFITVKRSKRKRKEKTEAVTTAPGIIEWITGRYLVLSLVEEDSAIVVASTSDYNLQAFPLTKAFQIGQRISVEKRGMRKTSAGCPIVSTQLSPLLWHRDVRRESPAQTGEEPLQVGDLVTGTVERLREGGVSVKISNDSGSRLRCTVPFIDLFDHFTDQITTALQPGTPIKGVVTKLHEGDVTLSVRASEGGSVEADVGFLDVSCPVKRPREWLERGDQIYGYVSGYGKKVTCLFISIARDMHATIYPPHLGDAPVSDLVQQFPLGMLIKGTVISLNYPKVGLSLRSGNKPLATPGVVEAGTVASVLAQGVYVALDASGLQGLVPREDLPNQSAKGFQKGQAVLVRISPLTDAFHLILQFTESQQDERMEIDEDSESERIEEMELEELSEVDFEHALTTAVQQEHAISAQIPTPAASVACSESKPSGRHVWDDTSGDTKSESQSVSERPIQPVIKSEAVKDQREQPQTDDDFERLLFSQPSSSYLWIRYMASCLEQGKIAKARATAERALDTIPVQSEKERLDIWLAYLNLERTQGGTPESLMALFQRAVLCNDPKKLHLAFLKVLEATGETEVGDQVLKSMQRRCPHSAKIYIQSLHYWLSTQRGGNCKRTLDAALKQLPKRKHIKLLIQAGILEFKLGKVEYGRDLFEGLISCYPKRMDIWNVYLDQELMQDEADHVRALFERAASCEGSRKSMKWIFKRYLQFEIQHGTPQSVQHVKDKAKSYIAKRTAT